MPNDIEEQNRIATRSNLRSGNDRRIVDRSRPFNGGLYTDHQGWGLDRRIGERRRLISSFEFAMLMETDNG